jgi:hypothetical protein
MLNLNHSASIFVKLTLKTQRMYIRRETSMYSSPTAIIICGMLQL